MKKLYYHLAKQEIDLKGILAKDHTTVFNYEPPSEASTRIFDLFLLDSEIVISRVHLKLFRNS